MVVLFLSNLFIVPCALLNQLNLESDFKTSVALQSEENPSILEIKMSMSLPYASEWESPKEGKGLLERNGDFYTLVERNFVNDTLYFKYIKNSNAREIFSLLSDKVGDTTTSDKPENSNSRSLLSSWMHLKFKLTDSYTISSPIVALKANKATNFSYRISYQSISLGIDGPPPKSV